MWKRGVIGCGSVCGALPLLLTSPSHTQEKDRSKLCAEFDVVIVGAGIAGVSLAHFLTSPRHLRAQDNKCTPSVCVLDRGNVCGEASGLSAGTLWTLGHPHIHPTTPPSLSQSLSEFRASSVDLYRELQAKHPHEVHLVQNGCVELALTPEEAQFARDVVRTEVDSGHEPQNIKLLTKPELEKLLPHARLSKVEAAVFARLGGHVNAPAACHLLAEAATARGAKFREHCEVQSIERDQGAKLYRVKMRNSDAEVTARCVVIAAGAWSDGLLSDVRVPVEPIKGQIHMSGEALPGTLSPVVYFFRSSVFWSNNTTTPARITHSSPDPTSRLTIHAYGRQGVDGRFYFGGDRVPVSNPRDCSANPDLLRPVDQYVWSVLPLVEKHTRDNPDAGVWAGLMPFSRDGFPLIGELAHVGYPDVWIAGGFGGSGIMTAPGAMEQLATVLLARSLGVRFSESDTRAAEQWLKPLSPDRDAGVTRVLTETSS